MTRKVLDIILGARSRILQEHRIPKRQKPRMTPAERTEYAQDQPIGKRLEMEERAGVLADQIVKNKRKFVSRKDVIRA